MTEEMKKWLVDQHREALTDGVTMGKLAERERIIERLKDQVCFDALADHDSVAEFRQAHPGVVGRCAHHGGKCTDILMLIADLQKGN